MVASVSSMHEGVISTHSSSQDSSKGFSSNEYSFSMFGLKISCLMPSFTQLLSIGYNFEDFHWVFDYFVGHNIDLRFDKKQFKMMLIEKIMLSFGDKIIQARA